MDRKRITERLSSNAGVFRSLLDGVGVDQARWKPAPEPWSLLEVINHRPYLLEALSPHSASYAGEC